MGQADWMSSRCSEDSTPIGSGPDITMGFMHRGGPQLSASHKISISLWHESNRHRTSMEFQWLRGLDSINFLLTRLRNSTSAGYTAWSSVAVPRHGGRRKSGTHRIVHCPNILRRA